LNEALDFVRSRHHNYIGELTDYLAIPSISSDPARQSDVAHGAEFTAQLMRNAGLDRVAIHPTSGHPIVTGEWLGTPGKPTFLVYGHYDVQPVDPLDLWEKDPFSAHIKDDRIIARGSADDKGQVFMHFKAVEAIIEKDGSLPINLKFVVEGEEEVGSPNLSPFLVDHKADLKADGALVSDTSMWAEGIPAITYGLRGLCYLEVELTGPNRDLHSGTYGGAVANPVEILARLLASVKDASGRIQIPGFYDRVVVPTDKERELFRTIPFHLADYKARLGVEDLWGESGWSPVEQTWVRPSFEVNGLWGGYTGPGAKTVLPAKANAKVSMRLVPDQHPDEIADLAERFFKERAPATVTVKVTRHHGGHPVVASLESPFVAAAERALRDAWNREPLFIREGGSIPIVADFRTILGLETLLLGYALPDNRAHSPNENFHLPTMFTGIESLVRLYYYLAG